MLILFLFFRKWSREFKKLLEQRLAKDTLQQLNLDGQSFSQSWLKILVTAYLRNIKFIFIRKQIVFIIWFNKNLVFLCKMRLFNN